MMKETKAREEIREEKILPQSDEKRGQVENTQFDEGAGEIENSQIQSDEEQQGIRPKGEALYEADIQINVSVLYDYFLRHVYTTFSGMIGTIIGVFMIIVYFVKEISILYLICGVIIILYLPWSLYLTAKKQSLQETFKNPLHYAFYENGVEVSQGETRQMQKWEDMKKAVSTSKSIILYTGKNSASIFPRKDLGENTEGLIKVIFTHMDPKKVKIKG